MTALSEKEGFCWASNKYFAELYDKNDTYISQMISDMNKKGYIDVFINSKDGNSRKIYIGGIQKNLKTSLEKTKDPSLEKPKHNTTSINTKKNEGVSYETSPPPTYKTKKKIYEQRGLQYKPKKQTEKQKRLFEANKVITEFREKANKHGFDLLSAENKQRNARISGQIQTMLIQKRNLKGFIDWWFDGNGEWCGYAPENLFVDRIFEEFTNKNIDKKEPLLVVEHLTFYTQEEITEAWKKGIIKQNNSTYKWQLNNSLKK
jgi:hypothetical protein